ncbi:MAG: choice-of-anchor tandem repeat NxxGxxAF-containing protein, partial [Planctomycetota bacterium]
VAREDDPAPGAGGAEYSFFSDPALNAAGDMAFEAFLRTGDTGPEVDGSNDGALFAFVDGEPQLIVREGDPFTVFPDAGPPEVRTISFIDFDRLNGMSDTGGLAFKLFFTDDTSGIFTTTIIPEPTSLALLATAAPLLLGRRRGRR